MKSITTLTTSQVEIIKSITISSTSQEEMVPGSISSDIVSEHALLEHACHKQPNCLLKSFTEQLSITSQSDEVSIDGVNDDNDEEKSVRMCALNYNENETASVNELQQNNPAELLERGQTSAPGRSTPLTLFTREPTADQTGHPSGTDCSRSSHGQRSSRSLQPGWSETAPGIPHASVGVRPPVELRNVPNSHNQYVLQAIPPVTIFPFTNSSTTPQFYNPSGRPTGGHFNSSLESSSAAATTSLSSSSLVSGTEDDLFTARRYFLTRDGLIYFQNDQYHVMHDSMRKHVQINVHTGAEIGQGLSKQHLVQTQQQSLFKTNSHVPQYNYFYNQQGVNRNEMLNSGSYPQTRNYELPCTYLPAFELLSNSQDTEQTASRRQTPSIEHKVVCPQTDFPLQVNPPCNNSDSSCNYVAENSYEIIRSPLHQINQHSHSNHSTHCVTSSPLNACASTGKSSNPAISSTQNRHTQAVDAGNHCLVQNPYSRHGHCESSLKNIKRESPLQQLNKGMNDGLFQTSAEAITEGIINDKTQMRNYRKETTQPPLKHKKDKTDKVQQWMDNTNNVSLRAQKTPYDYNTLNTCTGQDSLQAAQRDEITARHAHEFTEASYQPIGLFHGKPLSETQQSKQGEIKKHSPHNNPNCQALSMPATDQCYRPVKNGNLRHPCPEVIQKSQTQTEVRNCTYKSPTQSQHCNDADTCNGLRPNLPANVLFTDSTIEHIRKKQLPKYPFNGTSDNRCSRANIQNVDAPIDEEIKLLDEKSLQEPVMRLPTLSNRENVLGRDTLDLSEDRIHTLTATPNTNRYKGVISQTQEQCKSSCRRVQGDSVCTTYSDRGNCLKETSHKENGTPVRRGKHQMQTSNKGVHNLKEKTSYSCLKQKSKYYCTDVVGNFGADYAFNCESAEANFLYPYANPVQQNTTRDRRVYTTKSNSVNNLGGVPYNAPNHQNIRTINQHFKITENQTVMNAFQNHKEPDDINKYADNTTAEHFTGHQFVDVNQSLLPVSGSRNIPPSQTETYRYGTTCFLTSDLPNKDREHSDISYHNAAKVLEERTQHSQGHKLESQYISHSFQNNQTAGLFDAAHIYARQSVPSSQSKANQHSDIVPPSSQAVFVIPNLPCCSSSSSPQLLQDTTFKIPYSVDRHTSGSGFHYNETEQTAPCYPSISAGSDASMASDNSLSRSHIVKKSVSEKTHCYQHDFVCDDTLPTYNELQHQRPQIPYQQLHQRTHNPQVQLEDQNQKGTWQQEQLQLYPHQRDRQIISQDINDFQCHGSKGRMNLPCFLQSAHCDDSVMASTSHLQTISQHRLNQISLFQGAQSIQSETLDSIMTSISEKSHMSTGTSDDCYTDKIHSSEQQIQDIANPDTQQGSNNTANPNLNQMSLNSSKTVSSLQEVSGTSSSVTNPDRNIYNPTGSHFLEAIADDLFPPLNFEDCRDAMPLSPQSSPDINPVQTVTKPDQALVKDDGPGEPAGTRDQSTPRSCKHKNAGHKINTDAGDGSSNSACDGEGQVPENSDNAAGETEILSSDMSFLSGLQDEVNMYIKKDLTD